MNHIQILTYWVIPTFMLLIGIGIIIVWAADILKGKFSHMGSLFRWTNDGGDLMWPHLTAEFLTAAGLIISAIALPGQQNWALYLTLSSLGALFYTSLNSLGWVFAKKERRPYGVPMLVALIGTACSIAIIIIYNQI